MAESRPHVAAALLHTLMHAAPFTPHHARLLRALLGMRMLADAPKAAAAHTLRLRLHGDSNLRQHGDRDLRQHGVPPREAPWATSPCHWGTEAAKAEQGVALSLFRRPAACHSRAGVEDGGGVAGGGAVGAQATQHIYIYWG